MPHYFVDTSDGDRFIRDEIGLEARDLQAVRDEAMAALPSMGRELLASGDLRELFVIIRDPVGRVLCRVRLTIWCEWSD
ncbi:DUF6894 family protein [Muricoccus radiodurans]|uniref:DUF6894 family protein n=1 Tax=Muricoccus radiodurans TaxID=2231721 RepID=UPI003CE67E25